MKTIFAATTAAMLLASPVVTSDTADAGHRQHWGDYDDDYRGHRRHRDWDDYDDDGWKRHHGWKHHKVRKRHHRWVQRGGVDVKIIVYPGYPAYPECGGYCW